MNALFLTNQAKTLPAKKNSFTIAITMLTLNQSHCQKWTAHIPQPQTAYTHLVNFGTMCTNLNYATCNWEDVSTVSALSLYSAFYSCGQVEILIQLHTVVTRVTWLKDLPKEMCMKASTI